MPILENPRHERFAQALAAGKTADEAYQEAGYTENRHNASRLKTKDTIGARVAELLGRASDGVVIDRQWVLEKLIENANRAMQAQPVLDHDGEPTGEYRYEGSVANRALELLGKEMGMFVDRSLNQNVNTEFVVGAEPISREEWMRRHSEPETVQ